jgi:hypothetical protein
MDNIDIAILHRLNDLADRYGIKPYEFVASLERSRGSDGCAVTFAIPGETRAAQMQRVRQMYSSLGVDGNGTLGGGEIVILDAIDHALQIAPKRGIGM